MKKRGPNTITKKKSLRAAFGTLMVVLAACSTACGENVWIEDGFKVPSENITYGITPVLATAVRTRKKQSDKVSFEMHAGYERFYNNLVGWAVEDMNSDDWMYTLHLSIFDNNGRVVAFFDYELADFLNADIYFYTNKWPRRKFNFSLVKELNIGDIGLDKGSFSFTIFLIDNQLEYMNSQFKYGVSSSELYFSKSDNHITFSKKPFSS